MQFQHSFIQVVPSDHEHENSHIGEAFCKAYKAKYKSRIAIAENRGAIGIPDLMLDTCDGPIGVELVGYVAQDGYHELCERNDRLCGRLSIGLTNAGLIVDIGLHWKPNARGVPRVPESRYHDEFINEFIDFAQWTVSRGVADGRTIWFCTDNDEEGRKRFRPAHEFVGPNRFPVLSEFLVNVKLTIWNRPWQPSIRSLSARCFNLDDKSLEQIIMKKLTRLPTYRQSVGGVPLWLVVHSARDGSRDIPELRIPDAVKTMEMVLANCADRFDEAFLLCPYASARKNVLQKCSSKGR